MLRDLKFAFPLAFTALAGCMTTSGPHPTVSADGSAPYHPVILVSIDGLRPDYLDRGVSPVLNGLAARGARPPFMRPSFPSVTFPNHYTLVTGLRPDHHGIVANTMEDPDIPGVQFSMSNRDATTDRRWWDGGEPIWVTAEKHGIRTGTMFWPGSEAAVHGVRPSEWKPFDAKVSNVDRVDTVLGWLNKPSPRRPGLVTLYFDEVDHEGHENGPDSPEVTKAVGDIDRAIGHLVDGLAARHIDADIVVVSDHGMAPISPDRIIRLNDMMASSSYRLIVGGPVGGIAPASGKDAAVAAALLKPHDHMQCWRKADVPARFVFGHNRRVPPFICLAEMGWMISTDGKGSEATNRGAHGYDNASPEMRATFIAAGPDIRSGTALQAFDNVDVYPFVMALLHLAPLQSDGTLDPLKPALKRDPEMP